MTIDEYGSAITDGFVGWALALNGKYAGIPTLNKPTLVVPILVLRQICTASDE